MGQALDIRLTLSSQQLDEVAALLGHRPRGEFQVALSNAAGQPMVVRNAPFLYDGTPMPTLYWLIDPDLVRRVGQLESGGAVRQAEAELDAGDIADTHARYAAERDAQINPDHSGPRPSGGVGGTRVGIKCLHAHYGYFLVGGNDPVGQWVEEKLHQP